MTIVLHPSAVAQAHTHCRHRDAARNMRAALRRGGVDPALVTATPDRELESLVPLAVELVDDVEAEWDDDAASTRYFLARMRTKFTESVDVPVEALASSAWANTPTIGGAA